MVDQTLITEMLGHAQQYQVAGSDEALGNEACGPNSLYRQDMVFKLENVTGVSVNQEITGLNGQFNSNVACTAPALGPADAPVHTTDPAPDVAQTNTGPDPYSFT